jgi:hypothetical protein
MWPGKNRKKEAEHTKPSGEVLREALSYVEGHEQQWAIDPADIKVEQPENQQELLENLEHMLSSLEHGEEWVKNLHSNLAGLKRVAGAKRFAGSAMYINYDKDDAGSMHGHLTDNPEEPNPMVEGLLMATGAKTIRDDIADGNPDGLKIHKGMYEDSPVYFVEHIQDWRITAGRLEGTKYPNLSRGLSLYSEDEVRERLNYLSRKEAGILKAIGIETKPVTIDLWDENHIDRPKLTGLIKQHARIKTVD